MQQTLFNLTEAKAFVEIEDVKVMLRSPLNFRMVISLKKSPLFQSFFQTLNATKLFFEFVKVSFKDEPLTLYLNKIYSSDNLMERFTLWSNPQVPNEKSDGTFDLVDPSAFCEKGRFKGSDGYLANVKKRTVVDCSRFNPTISYKNRAAKDFIPVYDADKLNLIDDVAKFREYEED